MWGRSGRAIATLEALLARSVGAGFAVASAVIVRAAFEATWFAARLAAGTMIVATRFALLERFVTSRDLASGGAERRPVFAGGALLNRGRFPTCGRAFGLGGRENVELGFFSRDRSRGWRRGNGGESNRSSDGRGGWRNDSSRDRCGRFDVGRGGCHRRVRGLFRSERIFVFALRADDLEGAGLVVAGSRSCGGTAGRRAGTFATSEAGATGGAERAERLRNAASAGRGSRRGGRRRCRGVGIRSGGCAGRICICHCGVCLDRAHRNGSDLVITLAERGEHSTRALKTNRRGEARFEQLQIPDTCRTRAQTETEGLATKRHEN